LVQVYSPKSGEVEEKIFDEAGVFDKFGVKPNKLLLYRSLKGDSSDNLPGILRFPSKKIIELVETNETIENVVNNVSRVTLTDYQKKALEEFQNQALINWKLMRILTDIEVRLISGSFQRHKALEILDKYELKSLKSSVSLFEESEEGLGFFD
jgi:5'-3' exonuclease